MILKFSKSTNLIIIYDTIEIKCKIKESNSTDRYGGNNSNSRKQTVTDDSFFFFFGNGALYSKYYPFFLIYFCT